MPFRIVLSVRAWGFNAYSVSLFNEVQSRVIITTLNKRTNQTGQRLNTPNVLSSGWRPPWPVDKNHQSKVMKLRPIIIRMAVLASVHVLMLAVIIIIMYIYHVLINALSAHMIHINLNMIFYTHVKHSPTKTIYSNWEQLTNPTLTLTPGHTGGGLSVAYTHAHLIGTWLCCPMNTYSTAGEKRKKMRVVREGELKKTKTKQQRTE